MATVVMYDLEDKILHVQCNIREENVTTHIRVVGKKYAYAGCLSRVLSDDITPKQFKEQYKLVDGELVAVELRAKKHLDKNATLTEMLSLKSGEVHEFVAKHTSKELIELLIQDRISK